MLPFKYSYKSNEGYHNVAFIKDFGIFSAGEKFSLVRLSLEMEQLQAYTKVSDFPVKVQSIYLGVTHERN